MTTTTTANISFLTVPNLVTCSEVTIQWAYNGTAPPTSNYSLVVTNIGINQSGHNRRAYPLAPRQSTTVVNTTLAAINVTAGKFFWPKVNIPQGWYRMNIYASPGVIPSNTFNVTNGLDLSCVISPQSSDSPSPTSSTTRIPSNPSPYSTSLVNTPTATTSTLTVDNSSAKKRAIAGGVIGGVVALALVAAVALWLSRRRRKRARSAAPPATCPRTEGQLSKGNHSSSDSTGAILQRGGGNLEDPRQLSTSEDDFTSEKSAVVDEDTMPRLPAIAATRSYSKSSASTSSRRPTSMIVKPSFESYESVQSRPPTSPRNSRHLPDRSPRASRKPVPAYDPSEFPGSEPNDIPLSGPPETILGSGTKIYYIIPDAPLEQRK